MKFPKLNITKPRIALPTLPRKELRVQVPYIPIPKLPYRIRIEKR